jgi:hypothetical protein
MAQPLRHPGAKRLRRKCQCWCCKGRPRFTDQPRATRERLALLEATDELQTIVGEELDMVMDVLAPGGRDQDLDHWDWYGEYLDDLYGIW